MKTFKILISLLVLSLTACGGHDAPYVTDGTYALSSTSNGSGTDYIAVIFKDNWRAERRVFSVSSSGALTESASNCFDYSYKRADYTGEIIIDSQVVAIDEATEFVADENVSTQVAALTGTTKTFTFISQQHLEQVYAAATSISQVTRCQ